MKRILFFLLAMVMILSGCGGSESGEVSSEIQEKTQTVQIFDATMQIPESWILDEDSTLMTGTSPILAATYRDGESFTFQVTFMKSEITSLTGMDAAAYCASLEDDNRSSDFEQLGTVEINGITAFHNTFKSLPEAVDQTTTDQYVFDCPNGLFTCSFVEGNPKQKDYEAQKDAVLNSITIQDAVQALNEQAEEAINELQDSILKICAAELPEDSKCSMDGENKVVFVIPMDEDVTVDSLKENYDSIVRSMQKCVLFDSIEKAVYRLQDSDGTEIMTYYLDFKAENVLEKLTADDLYVDIVNEFAQNLS